MPTALLSTKKADRIGGRERVKYQLNISSNQRQMPTALLSTKKAVRIGGRERVKYQLNISFSQRPKLTFHLINSMKTEDMIGSEEKDKWLDYYSILP